MTKKQAVKLALTMAATGIMCDVCGGQATTCIYDGIKNGEPVTVGQAPVVVESAQLPVNNTTLVQWGS